MPLMPARVKYRKMQRGNRAGLAMRGNTVAFGEYGLQALERDWIDTKQLEAARVAVSRYMKRRGKVWIRIFPHKSYTKKPLETRMGKGKGPVESWVAVVRPPMSSSRWTASPRRWPANPCAWRPPSCPFAPNLSRATSWARKPEAL